MPLLFSSSSRSRRGRKVPIGFGLLVLAVTLCIGIEIGVLWSEMMAGSSVQEDGARSSASFPESMPLGQEPDMRNYERERDELKKKVASLQEELAEMKDSLRKESKPKPITTPVPAANIRGSGPREGRLHLETLKASIAASESSTPLIGVLVIACRRAQYLDRALTSFTKNRPDATHLPIVVSQDGHDPGVKQLLENSQWSSIVYSMRHEQGHGNGYEKLAQHYGWALGRMFDYLGFKQVIILEEDMEIAPDFFNYFLASLPLLKTDPKLYCVSAWNDNGYETAVQDPRMIYRTDFFPGLGWMLTSELWAEVRSRWPSGYWDEFMRRPDVRKGRHCLRPEISRSYTFGEEGQSQGQYFAAHLSRIKLNTDFVDFLSDTARPLRHVENEETFDRWLMNEMSSCVKVTLAAFDGELAGGQGKCLRIEYRDSMYHVFASRFGLMPDEKEGIRRTAYKGCSNILLPEA
ncbi:mannosyl (alpha-1,3-)-glycoprotein beta-1,2-N-acetylglucosaminyltransferase [Perkinsus olseni]|uniref:alpha-1,3-mannosyl-glycoprotein 2-beta-N-acetylglucosaminyltransferase n=1 Tax=Perkinsus olseni TaxID=32597 RepID=A0A7J6P3R6_PEROL|nr:mannosyl (alpha-1,3-)-glycoprotein beta-1,2-N-acetylglucosaminyltransferase [Perkinsus olseni]